MTTTETPDLVLNETQSQIYNLLVDLIEQNPTVFDLKASRYDLHSDSIEIVACRDKLLFSKMGYLIAKPCTDKYFRYLDQSDVMPVILETLSLVYHTIENYNNIGIKLEVMEFEDDYLILGNLYNVTDGIAMMYPFSTYDSEFVEKIIKIRVESKYEVKGKYVYRITVFHEK